MKKLNFDDKDLVIICVSAVMLASMLYVNQQDLAEILKLGMAGMFGLAVGKGTK
jgi:hypothetical protein